MIFFASIYAISRKKIHIAAAMASKYSRADVVMDIQSYLNQALEIATNVCTGTATPLEKLVLRDVIMVALKYAERESL